MRILDRAILFLLMVGWVAVGLVVDPYCAVPFRDEKHSIFLVVSGLLGVTAALALFTRGVSRKLLRTIWSLVPLGGLFIWRTLESLRDPGALGAIEPGLPARTDYLLRIVAPLIGGMSAWIASSELTLTGRRVRALGAVILGLVSVEVVGALCEVAGSFLGHDWRPFFFGATLSEARGGLKAALFGSIGNPNFLASYLALLILPVLAFGWSDQRRIGVRAFSVAAAILSIALVVMSRSKGALLALAGASLLTLLIGRGRAGRRESGPRPPVSGWWVAGGLLIVVVAVSAGVSSVSSGSHRESYIESWEKSLRLRGESASQRVLLAYVGSRMWEETRWAGVGPGEFRLRFLPELAEALSEEGEALSARVAKLKSLRPVHVHNDYLELLIEWGLLGYASGVGFLALAFASALRALGKSSGETHRFRLGLLGAAMAAALYALLEFPVHLPTHLILAASFLGLACARGEESEAAERRSAGTLGAVVGAVILVLGTCLVWHGVQVYRASRMAWSAGELATGGGAERNRAVSLMKRAVLADPGNADLGLLLAQFQWKLEGLPASARGTLRRTARISDDPNTALVETEILVAEGKFTEAAGALAPLLEVGPFLPGVGYLEGRILEARGETEKAAEAYRRDEAAIGNRPEVRHLDQPLLHLRYAGVLETLNQPREALEQYRKHLKALGDRGSNIPVAHLRMGRIYRDQLQDYVAAEDAFREALSAAERGGSAGEVENARRELAETRKRKFEATSR